MTRRIAITGMAARFPGASTVEQYWDNIARGVESIRYFSHAELLAAGVPAEMVRDPRYVCAAPILDDADLFDAPFFEYSPREARIMDPQQRVFLQAAWHALESAGVDPHRFAGTIGLFAGAGGSMGSYLLANETLNSSLYGPTGSMQHLGNDRDFLATKASFKLNLRGPTINVLTACSTSLVAVHLACQSLLAGECDVAIAGAVRMRTPQITGYLYEDGSILSPDGHCRPFDENAQGTLFGSGVGLVVLRRSEDAIADGDEIHAQLLASAINNDGASKMNYTSSSAEGLSRAISEALALANVHPETVTLVEAHGTGTYMGDPIEIQGLTRAFRKTSRREYCAIGSVKSNIGHVEHAAGVAGLIKAVMALKHRKLPPTINVTRPNPRIDFARTPFHLSTKLADWDPGAAGIRRAGVSSMGMGGTNAHVLLEEAPPPPPRTAGVQRGAYVISLSGKSQEAVIELAGKTADVVRSPAHELVDVCHSTNVGRAQLEHRVSVVAATREGLAEGLAAFARGETTPKVFSGKAPQSRPKVAFLFAGQGAQYASMGRALYDAEPVFRDAIDRCERALGDSLDTKLTDVLYRSAQYRIDNTAYAQPTLFAIEYALAELWRSWGVEPSAMLGHSIGEYCAATLAGAMTLEDALPFVAARGRLMAGLPEGGAMLSVSASEEEVRAALETHPGIDVAAFNAPDEIVLSGPDANIKKLASTLSERGLRVRPLTVSHAFHSWLMDPILDKFEATARAIKFEAPRIPIVTNLTGALAKGDEVASARYWREHLRGSVRCRQGLEALRELGCTVFIEIGPGGTLSELGTRTLGTDHTFVPSLWRRRDDAEQLHASLAQLHVRGVKIDWAAYGKAGGARKAPLPLYPFRKDRIAPMLAPRRVHRGNESAKVHPLLGSPLRSPAIREPIFQADLESDLDVIGGHKIMGRIVVPAVAYLEMIHAAAVQTDPSSEWAIEGFGIPKALMVPDGDRKTVQVVVKTERGGERRAQVFSREEEGAGDEWALHAEARLRAFKPEAAAVLELDAIRARCTEEVTGETLYGVMREEGFDWAPVYQGVQRLWRGADESVSQIELSEELLRSATSYGYFPGLLESCLQTPLMTGCFEPGFAAATSFLPIGVDQVRFMRPFTSKLWTHVRIHRNTATNETFTADLSIYDAERRLAAQLKQVVFKRARREVLEGAERETDGRYQVGWMPSPTRGAPPVTHPGGWLLVGASGALADLTGAALTRAGTSAVVARLKQALDVPAAESGGDWVLDAEDETSFERVVRRAASQLGGLRGIVHVVAAERRMSSADDVMSVQDQTLRTALYLLKAVQRASVPTRLFYVTVDAEAVLTSIGRPELAPIGGFARAVSLEAPELQVTTIDIDPLSFSTVAQTLADELAGADRERQVALRRARRFVPRLGRATPSARRVTTAEMRFRFAPAPELPQRVSVVRLDASKLAADEVEIAVESALVRSVDAAAVQSGEGSEAALGLDCAGTVTAVGSAVSGISIGDAVIARARGALASHVHAKASDVIAKPAKLTFDVGATIPSAFGQALAALRRAHQVAAEERVLVHGASTPAGWAAYEVARAAGASVVAEADPKSWRALTFAGMEWPVSSQHAGYVASTLEEGGGRRVDVLVRASRTGVFSESVALLRDGGVIVDLVPDDESDAAALNALAESRGAKVLRVRPDAETIERGLVGEAVEAVARGDFRLIPVTSFAFNDAALALQHTLEPHIGGTTLSRRAVAAATNVPPAPSIEMDPEAVYVVTGGLGGLSVQVVKRLVRHGARHFALLGRTPAAKVEVALNELRASASTISYHAADVGDGAAVDAVIAEISKARRPIRGIVHCAGVLEDGPAAGRDWASFQRVLRPKVEGAWNLHRASAKLPLDFFVLFSSAVSLLGSAGQSSYAAANAFLDALAEHRRSVGRPGLSINWGPWSEVGMAARVTGPTATWASGAVGALSPRQALDAFDRALFGSESRVAILPFRWAALAQREPNLGTLPLLERLVPPPAQPRRRATDRNELLEQLAKARPVDRPKLVAADLRNRVSRILGMSPDQALDSKLGFIELGLDSLMAVQLRNELQESYRRPLPYTLTYNYPSVEALAKFLAEDAVAAAPESQPITSKSARTLPYGPASRTAQSNVVVEEAAPASREQVDSWLEEEVKTLERLLRPL